MNGDPTLLELLQKTPGNPSAPMRQGLVDHLVAAGHVTEDGISRSAKVRTCQRCRLSVIVGLDADRAAMVASCDPIPLASLGQMLAVMAGHRLYELWRGRDRYELEPRDADRIDFYKPPCDGGRHRIDILRSHQCHARTPSATETAPSTFSPIRSLASDQPDF